MPIAALTTMSLAVVIFLGSPPEAIYIYAPINPAITEAVKVTQERVI